MEQTWCNNQKIRIFNIFEKYWLKLGKPTAKLTYNSHNPIGFKVLTRLTFGLSHLNEHNFRDFANPLWSCSLETEFLSHFFLHYHYFADISSILIRELQSFDKSILKFPGKERLEFLVYASPKFDSNQNYKILSSCISFILKYERFNGLLCRSKWN